MTARHPTLLAGRRQRHIARYLYKVDGLPPSGPGEDSLSVAITRSGQKVVFSNAEKGKTVYYYGRWVSDKGALGPWSDMVSALVI